MGRKIKQAKRCSVCGKGIRNHNQSGLCSHHNRLQSNLDRKKRRKNENLCVQCGKKIEPIIIYPAGKTIPPIIKHPTRCYDCRGNQKRWQMKTKLNKKNKELLQTSPLLSLDSD